VAESNLQYGWFYCRGSRVLQESEVVCFLPEMREDAEFPGLITAIDGKAFAQRPLRRLITYEGGRGNGSLNVRRTYLISYIAAHIFSSFDRFLHPDLPHTFSVYGNSNE